MFILSKNEKLNQLCTGDVVSYAICYAKSGFSPIPLQPNSKKCKQGVKDEDLRGRWLKFLTPDKIHNVELEISLLFEIGDNIALLTGEGCNLTVLDIDILEKFLEFYPKDKLFQQCGIIVRTASGKYHFWFEYDKDLQDANYNEIAGFEVLNRRRVVVPPSKIEQDSYVFVKCETLTKMPKNLKSKILFLQTVKRSSRAKTLSNKLTYSVDMEQLKTQLLEYWTPGQRQFLAMYTAGLLRKAGVSGEETEEFIQEICELANDEEIKMRLEAVKSTYKKPLGEVCGITGLKELGIEVEVRKEEKAKGEKEGRTNLASLLLDILIKEKLFHYQDEAFIRLDSKVLPISSRTFANYVNKLSFEKFGRPAYSECISQIKDTLSGIALFDKPEEQIHLRVATTEDYVEILLNHDVTVFITKDTIEIGEPKSNFIYSPKQLPLPTPVFDQFDCFKAMQEIFGTERSQNILLYVFGLKSFWTRGEYILLLLCGRDGAGKSTTAKLIVLLIDPKTTLISSFPKNEEDLVTVAKQCHLLAFDNLSHLTDGQSDALCRIITGAGFSKRKLFTDYDAVDYPIKNPVILTSINPVCKNRDLRRRTFTVEVKKPPIRLDEKVLLDKWQEIVPYLLGAYCLALQEALKNDLTGNIHAIDLADTCYLVKRAERQLPFNYDEFLNTVKSNRVETAEEFLQGTPLVEFIIQQLEDKTEVSFTASELLSELKDKYQNHPEIPKSANALSRVITKLANDFEDKGVRIIKDRNKDTKLLIFKKIADDDNGDTIIISSSYRHPEVIEKQGKITNDDNDDIVPFFSKKDNGEDKEVEFVLD